MAIQHVVAGASIVTFQSYQLGYTRDGVRIRIEPKWNEIKSDDYGGEGGAPADQQLLGAEAIITCDLTKYDAALVEKLTAYAVLMAGATAGTIGALGTLVRQDSKTGTLLIDGDKNYTFATAFCFDSHELNAGTKYQTWNLGFKAWIDAPATRVLMAIS